MAKLQTQKFLKAKSYQLSAKDEGFTLIEFIIVIGISTILVGMSFGVFTTFSKRSNVDVEARNIESVLNLSRNRTLASDGEQVYGVHLDSSAGEYILFPGSVYSASDPENENFKISSQVSISSIDIQGGGSDIVFSRLYGATSQYGSIILERQGDSSRTQAICIDPSGSIEVRSACQATSISYTGGISDGDLASFPGWSGDPAQSFTTGTDNIYVRGAELYLKRSSLGPGDVFNLYLEIRGTSTVGNVLGRSWMVSDSSLSSNLSWVSFVFPDPILLLANTQYFLRVRSLPDATFYDPGNPMYTAQGLVYWGYEHSSSTPPSYSGGDTWRYVGLNEDPLYQGDQLGPIDQYDFSFRVLYGVDPPQSKDSRHIDLELEDVSGVGWSMQGASTLTFFFSDVGGDVTENISMASYFSASSTEFDWKGSVDVNGDTETLRVHSYYIDSNDTTLSIHRDRGINGKAVDVSIDGRTISSYAADGTVTSGLWGGVIIHR